MTDIYKALKADHDKARDLMTRIAETSDGAVKTREKLFDAFKLDMWSHNKIEEALFYQPLRQAKATAEDAHEALSEHHVAAGLIEELDSMPKDSPAWIGKFAALKDMIEHHMEEEETEIFTDARKVIDADRAEAMGKAFQARKETVLPALRPE